MAAAYGEVSNPTLDMNLLALDFKQLRRGLGLCLIAVVVCLPNYGNERHGSRGRPAEVGPEGRLVRLFHESVVDIGSGKNFDRELFRARLIELVEIELPEGPKKRKDLARAWRAAAAVVQIEDGDTPQLLEMLEVALAIDPDNEILANEVALHRERLDIIEARVAAAEAARAARNSAVDSSLNGGER